MVYVSYVKPMERRKACIGGVSRWDRLFNTGRLYQSPYTCAPSGAVLYPEDAKTIAQNSLYEENALED